MWGSTAVCVCFPTNVCSSRGSGSRACGIPSSVSHGVRVFMFRSIPGARSAFGSGWVSGFCFSHFIRNVFCSHIQHTRSSVCRLWPGSRRNYICTKVREDTAASVLAGWVIFPEQKATAPPSYCHWRGDIMSCMEYKNSLHHSRICK